MKQDEIIEMPPYLNAAYEGDDLFTGKQLRAAVLAEREACAKMCEDYTGADYDTVSDILAAAIRARGEQA